jgi:hypothetical protein
MATIYCIERPMPARKGVPALVLVGLLGLLASPALAQKTDMVHMDNGNVIVGEIKKLEHGLLEFSVDDIAGNLRITDGPKREDPLRSRLESQRLKYPAKRHLAAMDGVFAEHSPPR